MSVKLDPVVSDGPAPAPAEQSSGGPLPPPPAVTRMFAPLPRAWMSRWEADLFQPASALAVGSGILRAQGAVARDLMRDRRGATYLGGLALLALAATAIYGAILGSFSGPQQMVFAAIKFPLVILGSCAICLPSFHVFNALMGARVNLLQSANAVLLLAAAAGLILLACAPVVWFFSISTDDGARGFMVALHLLTLGVAGLFGIHLLWRVHRYALFKDGARFTDGRVLALWLGVFLLVSAQLAHFVGPLLAGGEFFTGERGFFLRALFSR